MAKGLITRRGGLIGTKAPSINLVSKSFYEFVFTITNNEDTTVDIFWEVDDDTPEENTFSLSAGATSGNITVDSLDFDTTYIIYAFAIKSGKSGSVVSTLSVTTDDFSPIDATGGTVSDVTIGGIDYRIHAFTSTGSSTFTVNNPGTDPEVDVLVVAGGGGGGAGEEMKSSGLAGGGGGAGGVVTENLSIASQSYSIQVGSGGTGAPDDDFAGENGENSSAFGFTALGGGGGGSSYNDYQGVGGRDGGSGGGAGAVYKQSSSFYDGGIGLQPSSASSGFGNNGADWNSPSNSGDNRAGSGGGGADEPGLGNNSNVGGNGGDGLYVDWADEAGYGENGYFAGGGGGGGSTEGFPSTGGDGGLGGGGKGGDGGTSNRISGQSNTGGGGGGGGSIDGNASGANGGSGIVLIRYPLQPTT